MGIIKFATSPFRVAGNIYHNARKRSTDSVGDYTAVGGAIGAISGTVLGIGAGIAGPLYVGWEIGNYISTKLELHYIVNLGTDLITSVATLGIVGGASVPILGIVGLVTGGIGGAVIGTGIGVGKKSLDCVVSRN